MSRLLLLGFGGHARSVADVALAAGFTRLLFVDEHGAAGANFAGFPVVAAMPPLDESWPCIPCAGRNDWRREQLRRLVEEGRPLATVVSPRATVGVGAEIRAGTFVGHHAHIGPLAHIGAGCIVNTAAVVEHDCVVGDFSHVSVHATVAGRSRLGELVFIGAGATVVDGVSIVSGVTLGAGGVAVADIGEPGTYAGVPARRLR